MSNWTRDERITTLAREFCPARIFAELVKAFPDLTRNAVISVITRKGPHDVQSLERRKADAKRWHKENAGRRPRNGNLGLAEPTAEQKARADRPKPVTPVPPKPNAGPPRPPAVTISETPPQPDDEPVPADKRTGCVWPFGERQDIRFCNRKKCRVRTGSGHVRTVNYCDRHWEARRSSKHTTILAD